MNYLVKSESALFYECGYSCDNGLFLRLKDGCYFITDGRYTIEAREFIKNSSIEIVEARDIFKKASEIIRKHKIKELIVDPKQFSLYEFEKLSSKLKINFKKRVGFEQLLRIKKSETEIEILKKAHEINRAAFENFLNFIKEQGVGRSEKELFLKAKEILTQHGLYELSFTPIVAINQNAAKAHALPSNHTILKNNDILLFDAGIKYKNYCSDSTRTTIISKDATFNKIQHLSKREYQKIYDTVLKAQEHAITHLKAGMKANEVDALARDIIAEAGYKDYFTHSLGHGIGLDIHELPIISKNSQTIIEDGMVFSIEPGIYIEGEIGVRIEDIVVIKNGRAEIL